jgi:glucose-1-phosphate thymidylyltransferase
MKPTKAVILARGLGTRMRRAETAIELDASQSAVADTGLKAMIPVGRPFLDYVLSGLADAGFTDVCLIIGPEHDAVRRHYADPPPRRVRLHFAVQPEPRGTADALLAAEAFAADDEFIALNSDNYYPRDVLEGLRDLGEPGAVMFREQDLLRNSNIPAERIRSFAYAKTNQNGYLIDLVEKPGAESAAQLREHSLISMNCWRFACWMFEYCRAVPISARGEYELPNAVRIAVHDGKKLKITRSSSGVLDLSVRGDIAAVAHRLSGIQVSL